MTLPEAFFAVVGGSTVGWVLGSHLQRAIAAALRRRRCDPIIDYDRDRHSIRIGSQWIDEDLVDALATRRGLFLITENEDNVVHLMPVRIVPGEGGGFSIEGGDADA